MRYPEFETLLVQAALLLAYYPPHGESVFAHGIHVAAAVSELQSGIWKTPLGDVALAIGGRAADNFLEVAQHLKEISFDLPELGVIFDGWDEAMGEFKTSISVAAALSLHAFSMGSRSADKFLWLFYDPWITFKLFKSEVKRALAASFKRPGGLCPLAFSNWEPVRDGRKSLKTGDSAPWEDQCERDENECTLQ